MTYIGTYEAEHAILPTLIELLSPNVVTRTNADGTVSLYVDASDDQPEDVA